jgi:hypothetical protein
MWRFPPPSQAGSRYVPRVWDGTQGRPLLDESSSPYVQSSSSHITEAQMPVHGSLAQLASPYNNFSHYFHDKIIVKDFFDTASISKYQFLLTGNGTKSLSGIVKQSTNAVGKILYQGRFISTAVVIAQNTIITARHCVNGCRLNELTFVDTKFGELYSLGLLEDGSIIDEDYVIFRLFFIGNPSFNLHVSPLEISNDYPTNGEWLVCFGYALQFVSYLQYVTMGRYDATDQNAPLKLVTHATTQAGFSGAPYINSKGEIIGIHLKTTHEILFAGERTGLLFANLIDPLGFSNSSSSWILTQLINASHFKIQDVSLETMTGDEFFDEFSTLVERFLETEEGLKRNFLFGNTPALTSGTGIAVLKRSETQNMAEYKGIKIGEAKYKDHAHWEVKVQKVKHGAWLWVALTEKDPRPGKAGKAGIQMGHLLSVAEYWDKGDKIAGSKYRYPAKNKWTNKANRATFKKTIARPFMTDSNNYQFEWCELNELNGSGGILFNAPAGHQWVNNAKGKPELT